MSKMNINVEPVGMNPTAETVSLIKNELDIPLSLTPKNSEVRYKYHKHGDGFEGQLIIRSTNIAFIATGTDKDLISLTRSLRKKVKVQILKWRNAKLDSRRAS